MNKNIPSFAKFLGFAGLLPQLLCFAALFDVTTRYIGQSAAFFYAALIFSFIGGLWWGLAVAKPEAPRWIYAAAVAPTLVAFFSGIPWMIGTTWPGPSLGLLGIAIIGSLWVDVRLNRLGIMPDSMLQLRKILSVGLGIVTFLIAIF